MMSGFEKVSRKEVKKLWSSVPFPLFCEGARKAAAAVFAAERAAAGAFTAVAVRARKAAVQRQLRDAAAELPLQIGTYGVVVQTSESILHMI